ncbi:hypothetical protein F2Q70_00003268 [Brassica cretica]|uniref:Uncharacterized protein n=1 Tax=Brassica cretica TaxID=69181 RepID=A0A8S9IZH9_BRACR|nr:hypothetical protein F2Q70_00003268 [Brassica cretica]
MECKHLIEVLFTGYKSGTVKVKPPKKKPKSNKNWSKNKERKAQRQQDMTTPEEPRVADETVIARDRDDTPGEEKPANRRRVLWPGQKLLPTRSQTPTVRLNSAWNLIPVTQVHQDPCLAREESSPKQSISARFLTPNSPISSSILSVQNLPTYGANSTS